MVVEEDPGILLYTRIRKSPYFDASRQHGVRRYSVYNHTYHPRHYGDPVGEYWALLEGVTLWDVGVERQIEISGPDAFTLLVSPEAGGNDHGRFRSQFGVQAFEKTVGTAGFEPATP